MTDQKCQDGIHRSIAARLDRRRQNSTLRTLSTNPSTSVDFSSNDFLSLAKSPALRKRFLCELERHGSDFDMGSGGSRLLDGNSRYAEELEEEIAAFHGAPAGLLCNSGFDANVGLFSCIPQPRDVIVYDEYIHASVHDGMKHTRAAQCLPFAHNSISALRTVLRDLQATLPTLRDGTSNVFIAVESVYSMDGDVAPLTDIVNIANHIFPQRNAHIIVDEAHSTGVFGPRGRGLVCELGLEDRVFARLHTFGKALACNGAIILCSELVRHYLVNYARSLIYTTFMSFPCLAAIRASYSLLQDGSTETLARNLQDLIRSCHAQLRSLEAAHQARCQSTKTFSAQKLLRVATEQPISPIFSVQTSEPRNLAKYCQEGGFVVRAIVPPTVPAGSERIRVCLRAGNTNAEVTALVARIESWLGSRMEVHEQAGRVRARL
ncbi:hypothetical protein LTR66_002933 [Elasticomyces elasticus]|nr:hypothetical protein LTR66_002933 [Elasticomyces elasticus]